jgi:iron complex outermembrane receptor protein
MNLFNSSGAQGSLDRPDPGRARPCGVSVWRRQGCEPLSVAAAVSMLLACGTAFAENAADGGASSDASVLQEITVTATRRAEDINKVPVSITAYTPEQMDDQGVRQIDDLARLTPDLQFTHTSGAAGNNSSNISIRGVFSDVGAATTGVYIDDTPIQMRNVGYWNANAFPQVFDLERVEVLRGPQGTLFGAGAEGGAIRFITPEPGLEKYSGYARTEVADTVSGAPSYEGGAAIGGPIVADKLGFRVSAWGRNDGGYIDRVSPDTGQTVDSNSNYQHSFVGRAALAAVPVEDLKVTASLLYQNIYNHDRDQYWDTLSDASDDRFKQGSRVGQPTKDEFYLPSLKVEYDLPKVSFVSNTSYFYHKDFASLDYTNYFAGIFDGDPMQFLPGDAPSQAFITNRQNAFTEEARLQSVDEHALIDWTVGVFYSDVTQKDQDLTTNGQAVYTSENGTVDSFDQYTKARDQQIAGYANVDLNVTSQVKVTAGIRVAHDKFDFDQESAFSGAVQAPITGSRSDTPVTPKFGASYQLDPNNFLYASAAKGYRQGGVNEAVPTDLCSADLTVLGLSKTPTAYSPDNLWSFEVGAKDNLFGGRLGLDSSVYALKWRNIQQSVRLPSCGFSYVGNLGTATGVGGNLSTRFKVTDAFLAGINAGYVSLTYDKTILEGPDAILVNKGDVIGGSPFHLSAWTLYKFNLFDHGAFYRIDYTYQNGTPAVDSQVFSYDSTLRQPGPQKSLSMRAGMYLGAWEVSVFGNNLTKEESPLAISHDIPGAEPQYLAGYRPLTFGLTAAYRF